jgi:predicted phosphodiesterase
VPTRLAIFSDVHGDLQALEQAFEAASRLGCTRYVCAGDVVDYGLFPDETIALLAARGVPTIRGNHDRWALKGAGEAGGSSWGADLSLPSRLWLRGLPERWSETVEGTNVVAAHARPGSDMHGIDPRQATADEVRAMLAAARADVLIVGHTHEAFELELAGWGKIVNPAALLRDPAPGDDNPAATGTFGVLELPSGAFTVHRAADGAIVEPLRRKV